MAPVDLQIGTLNHACSIDARGGPLWLNDKRPVPADLGANCDIFRWVLHRARRLFRVPDSSIPRSDRSNLATPACPGPRNDALPPSASLEAFLQSRLYRYCHSLCELRDRLASFASRKAAEEWRRLSSLNHIRAAIRPGIEGSASS